MSESAAVLVRTLNGPVLGRHRRTSANNADPIDYVSFQGIPYAQPPIGELRFRAPRPIGNWTEPLEAFKQPSPSVSINLFTGQMEESSSEDCLFLNVYTREARANAKRPVMVWIHGGGFMTGSTDMYDPEFLLRSDIVYVSIGYRLGALGFLSLADPTLDIPGNAGLKDQRLALRWVRDNIARFGGDPLNVTLFGESAGACATHMHMLSEGSRGLFQRAVLQSGQALSMWGRQPGRERQLNEQLARRLGWRGEDGDEAGMMAVIGQADAREIVRQQHCENELDKQIGHYFVYVPVVEPYETEEAFLTRPTEELLAGAWGNRIPMMCGFTKDEGLFFYKLWLETPGMWNDDGYIAHMVPWAEYPPTSRPRLTERLTKQYYGEERPSVENLRNYVDMMTDKFFGQGLQKAIRAREEQKDSAPTYLYRFEYDSKGAGFQTMKQMRAGGRIDGAMHCEELVYLFKVDFFDYALPAAREEMQTVERMVNLWTQFAATGNPNNAKLVADGVEKWPQLDRSEGASPSGYRCLNIGDRLQLIALPEMQRWRFWESLERDALSEAART